MSDHPSPAVWRLVLIEDNPADVYLIREALQEAGLEFDLTLLEDGGLALAYLAEFDRGSGAEIPNLIILDLNLPKYDGRTVLQAIRDRNQLEDVRVVVLTTSRSARDREAVEEADPRAVYLTKPSELDDFLALGTRLRDILLAGEPVPEIASEPPA